MASPIISLTAPDAEKLRKRLKQAPTQVQDQLNRALLDVAIMMERQAKMTVPVITGRLQSSILTERQELEYSIAPHTNYAEQVHSRKPYMDTAFDIMEPAARQRLNTAVRDIIGSI